jgi:hypothetical protein
LIARARASTGAGIPASSRAPNNSKNTQSSRDSNYIRNSRNYKDARNSMAALAASNSRGREK